MSCRWEGRRVGDTSVQIRSGRDAVLDRTPALRFTGLMKATIEIPDDLYRLVEAKSTLEGRAVGEVTVELFQLYVGKEDAPTAEAGQATTGVEGLPDGEPTPSWFGALRRTARAVRQHEMSAIRESIARGIVRDRNL